MKKYILALLLIIICTLPFVGCKKKEITNSSSVSAASTSASKEEPTIVTLQDTTKETDAVKNNATSVSNPPISFEETYLSDKLSIKYPTLTNLANPANEAIVNELIKTNAMSIINAYNLDPTKDSLDISYNLIYLDRNRVTILYTGEYRMNYAAYPTAISFTNTINLNTGKNIRLTDYIDATALGKVLVDNGDYKVITNNLATEKEIRDYLNNMELSTLEALFNDADFGGTNPFPESFSYEEKGSILFTVTVPHAMGDYIKLSYTPESK